MVLLSLTTAYTVNTYPKHFIFLNFPLKPDKTPAQ